MDAFFASVEQVCNPRLSDHPVMVCGDPETRTVVAAANYKAREYGVKSGMPLIQAKRLCPQGICIEGHPEKYVYFSLKLKSICQEFTPLVEVFSIDESFLDITQTQARFGGHLALAQRLKKAIRDQLHLTASVGIASNKLLAKVASGLQKPDGLTTLFPWELGDKFLILPVKELIGVGEATARKLGLLRIRTIGDLSLFPRANLEKLFGVAGVWLHQAAQGWDDSPVVPEERIPPVKSVGNGFTLDSDTTDGEWILQVVQALCAKVGRRLRQGKMAGRTVTLHIRFSDYTLVSRSLTTDFFLCLDKEIFETVRFIYRTSIHPEAVTVSVPKRAGTLPKHHGHRPVRYVGVSVSNLIFSHHPRQQDLLDYRSRAKQEQVVKSMDRIRDIWGERMVTWGNLIRPAPS